MKMKNKFVYGVLVMGVLLLSTPVTAQNFGAQQPNTVFQSTSTMTPTGSQYSSNPTLNSNGTAVAPTSGPYKAKKGGLLPPPPTVDPNDTGNTPLGDALIPLMLCACAYLIVRATRRRTLNR